jgi:hypothetical protein
VGHFRLESSVWSLLLAVLGSFAGKRRELCFRLSGCVAFRVRNRLLHVEHFSSGRMSAEDRDGHPSLLRNSFEDFVDKTVCSKTGPSLAENAWPHWVRRFATTLAAGSSKATRELLHVEQSVNCEERFKGSGARSGDHKKLISTAAGGVGFRTGKSHTFPEVPT